MAAWDEIMWSWAAHNVAEDLKEQERLLFSFVDTLTWWLQPELRRRMEREKADQWPDASGYIEELRKAGASEEYIAKEVEAICKEREKKRQIDELAGREPEEDDSFEVLRSPAKPNA